MKIAYLINHDISKNDGVTKKILNQTNEWKNLGNEVVVFCNTSNYGKSILNAKQYEFRNFIKDRLFINKELLNDLDDFNPSLIYFRYDTWSASIQKISKKYTVITELNTNDLGEYFLLFKKEKNVKSLFRFLAYFLFRHRVFSNVKGIVSVTEEILNLPSVAKFKKKGMVIPNAIDLRTYKVIKTNKEQDRIGLFFIGTPNQPWHGIDIIEKLSNKLPEFDFHVVGIKKKSENNLFYHGFLQKNDYLKILKKCNICIGSLALFRNNMVEACPLKVREYLAYGYPIIIGYNDTAFLKNKTLPKWLLQINPNKIQIDLIKNFILQNKDTIIKDKEIDFISSTILEHKRVEFFRQFL